MKPFIVSLCISAAAAGIAAAIASFDPTMDMRSALLAAGSAFGVASLREAVKLAVPVYPMLSPIARVLHVPVPAATDGMQSPPPADGDGGQRSGETGADGTKR